MVEEGAYRKAIGALTTNMANLTNQDQQRLQNCFCLDLSEQARQCTQHLWRLTWMRQAPLQVQQIQAKAVTITHSKGLGMLP